MGAENNVLVIIIDDALPVDARNFGVPLHVTEDVSFSERTKTYASSLEAQQDTELGTTAVAAVEAHFSQALHAPTIKIGRRESDTAQVVTWTVTGTPVENDVFAITVNGETGQHVATAGQDATAVAGALKTALTTALAAEPVTVGGTGTDITVTADDPGEPFTYSNLYTPTSPPGTAGIAEVLTTANVNIATELIAITAEDPAWYFLTLSTRDDDDILRAAAWIESDGQRGFVGQSDTADVLTDTTPNVLDTLKSLGYSRTAYLWHHDDTQYLDVGAVSYKLQCDLDRKSTFWAYTPVTGVSVKSPRLTTTEYNNVLDNNGNVFDIFGRGGVLLMGRMVDGQPIDRTTSKDWWKARHTEAIQQVLLDASARNEKIPFDDSGFPAFVSEMENVNGDGENANHFSKGTTTATFTPRSKLTADDATNRRAQLQATAFWADAAEKVTLLASVTSRALG